MWTFALPFIRKAVTSAVVTGLAWLVAWAGARGFDVGTMIDAEALAGAVVAAVMGFIGTYLVPNRT
jgi:hypothetical protein